MFSIESDSTWNTILTVVYKQKDVLIKVTRGSLVYITEVVIYPTWCKIETLLACCRN